MTLDPLDGLGSTDFLMHDLSFCFRFKRTCSTDGPEDADCHASHGISKRSLNYQCQRLVKAGLWIILQAITSKSAFVKKITTLASRTHITITSFIGSELGLKHESAYSCRHVWTRSSSFRCPHPDQSCSRLDLLQDISWSINFSRY